MASSPSRPLPHSLTTAGMLHFGSSMPSLDAAGVAEPEPEPEPEPAAEPAPADSGGGASCSGAVVQLAAGGAAAPSGAAAGGAAAGGAVAGGGDRPLGGVLPTAAPVGEWSADEAIAWAASTGLPESPCLENLRKGRVDGAALLELESDEVRALPPSLPSQDFVF